MLFVINDIKMMFERLILYKFLILLFNVLAIINADITGIVGPGGQYSSINEAVDALSPFSEDVTLYVTVPNEGITEPMDIDYLKTNGHELTIRGVRQQNTKSTYYFDDGIEFVLDELMQNQTTEYVGSGIARRVTESDGTSSGNQYYIKNHLGSTMMMVNALGSEALMVYDYLPYGKKIVESGHSSEKDETKTFPGKELDVFDDDMDASEDGAGLYYFGARYYDADIGLWTSTDPLGQYVNSYSYGPGNPISGTDPDGQTYYLNEDGTYQFQEDNYPNRIILQEGSDRIELSVEMKVLTDEIIQEDFKNQIELIENQNPIHKVDPGLIVDKVADMEKYHQPDKDYYHKDYYIYNNKWYRSDLINYAAGGMVTRYSWILRWFGVKQVVRQWAYNKDRLSYRYFWAMKGAQAYDAYKEDEKNAKK